MRVSIQTDNKGDKRLADAILLNFAKGYNIETKVAGNQIRSSAVINPTNAVDLFSSFEHESLNFQGFATFDVT